MWSNSLKTFKTWLQFAFGSFTKTEQDQLIKYTFNFEDFSNLFSKNKVHNHMFSFKWKIFN